MGTSVVGELNAAEMQQLIQQHDAIASASTGSEALAAGKFTYLGFFRLIGG